MTHPLPEIIPLSPNRVWRTYPGGRTLDRISGLPAPADTHFPEDWIGSVTRAVNKGREDIADEGLSRVTIGTGAERLLANLIRENPEYYLGSGHVSTHGTGTGFLLKFLDSAVRLHIQCHPTIAFARERLGSSSGKTEAYCILSIREEVSDPYIYLGFQRPPDRKRYREAILAQDREAILAPFDRIPVRPGDAFIVPGGLPHAIGEGIFMIEIMEPTDFAVRIEFERGGYVLPEAARFMGRDVDFALDMMEFAPLPRETLVRRCFLHPAPLETHADGSSLVSIAGPEVTPCFRVERLTVHHEARLEPDSFACAIVTSGTVEVSAPRRAVRFPRYGRFFLPFGSRAVGVKNLSPDGTPSELVIVRPPR